MLRTAAVIAACLAFGAIASADRISIDRSRLAIDVTGSYGSNWGAVTLHQRGAAVTGTYVFDGGRLDGTLDGNVVRYAWHERAGSGHGVFVVASNGELIGTWGVGKDDLGGGGWRLTPRQAALATN